VDAPVSVEMPAVGIDADVLAVGTAEDGQMELPEDPNVVGWYRFGPTAGAGAGSIVLAAHVDSRRYGIGQLARLTEAEIGDEIEVRTSGDVHTYVVTDVQVIPKAELPTAEVFSRDGAERLLLITCAGDFDGAHYLDNAIVTARPK
jgi:LPXTG-site transpeptidase (sortase) family protein